METTDVSLTQITIPHGLWTRLLFSLGTTFPILDCQSWKRFEVILIQPPDVADKVQWSHIGELSSLRLSSAAMKRCFVTMPCYAQSLSQVQLFATLWTLALQAPLSMGFSRQEHWSRLPFPPPGDLLNPGIEPLSPGLAGRFFTTSTTWEAQVLVLFVPCIIEPRQTHLFGIVSSSVSQRVYWAPTECKEICLWSDPTTSCNLESHYLRTSTNLYTAGGGTHTKPRTEETGVRGDWWRDVHSGWFQRGN